MLGFSISKISNHSPSEIDSPKSRVNRQAGNHGDNNGDRHGDYQGDSQRNQQADRQQVANG